MQPTDSMDLEYAECFSVDHYDGGYSLITVKDDARYLVVPENASAPDGLDADIVVLQQPLDSIYLVSSSVMDQFVALDALDSISLSGTKQDGWYIDEARQAMADGRSPMRASTAHRTTRPSTPPTATLPLRIP